MNPSISSAIHAPGVRSFDTNLATLAFFSIDANNGLAQFNQEAPGDFGDWFSPGTQVPEVQDAFGTPGATPDMGVELRRLDVLGFTRIVNSTPVVTAAANQTASPGVATAIDLGSFADPDTGPWSVSVNWGDSSTTSFFVANAGALGTLTHTYTTAGTYSPQFTVTDFTSLSGSATFNVDVISTTVSTSVSLDASNNLVIKDIAAGGKADNIVIQADTANSRYIITDNSAAAIFGIVGTVPGATISANMHQAFVPFAAVTGSSIIVDTMAGDDQLTVDKSLGSFSKTITFDGGAGNNTLTAPNQTNAWNITAANAGNITGLASFTNVQNLVGGSGNDTFKLSDNVGVSGSIAGGGGTNTLNNVLYSSSHPISYNLATKRRHQRHRRASKNPEPCRRASTSDTLIGPNANTTWTITANKTGTAGAFAFSNIENSDGRLGRRRVQYQRRHCLHGHPQRRRRATP